MIIAALRAGLVLVAALVLAAPALGEPGNAATTQSVGGDLRSEYPLHDSKECCSSAPTPAAAIDRPGGGADGQVDGNGGLTLWLLALALASCLGLAWFVHSRPETIPRVDLSRAAAIAGAVPRAVRRIDLTRVTEAARAVPRAARRIDLKGVVAVRDRSGRGGASNPEPEPSADPEPSETFEDRHPIPIREGLRRRRARTPEPEPPTAEPEPPTPEPQPEPTPSEPPKVEPKANSTIEDRDRVPIRKRMRRGRARTPEPEPSVIGENREGMDDEPPTPARRDPPPRAPRALPGDGPGVAPPPVQLVAPRTFAEAQAIRDGFSRSSAVILDLRATDPDLATGLTYFASGFTFGLSGAMQELAEDVYLLIPRDVQISAEETARLRASLVP